MSRDIKLYNPIIILAMLKRQPNKAYKKLPLRCLSVIVLITSCIFSSCKTISFQKYFPLKKGDVSVYTCVVDSTNKEYKDTVICREATAKLGSFTSKKSLFVRNPRMINGIIGKVHIYYFERINTISKDSSYMNDYSFAENLYCFYKRKLFVSWGWTKDMEYDNGDFPKLFPKRLKVNEKYSHKNGDYVKYFVYKGKETVHLKDKIYQNCIKIDIIESFRTIKPIATVWLAKKIGVVKRQIKNDVEPFMKP